MWPAQGLRWCHHGAVLGSTAVLPGQPRVLWVGRLLADGPPGVLSTLLLLCFVGVPVYAASP